MKRIILSFVALVLTMTVLQAQVSKQFSYQAVARDGDGQIIADQSVGVRINIWEGGPSGTVVYTETHDATTNAYGLFNLKIGGGTVTAGAWMDIDWADDAHWVEVEIDPAGGTSYVSMGAAELLSVPYAIFAQSAGSTAPNGSIWADSVWVDYLYVDSSWTEMAYAGKVWSEEVYGERLGADSAWIDYAWVDSAWTVFEVTGLGWTEESYNSELHAESAWIDSLWSEYNSLDYVWSDSSWTGVAIAEQSWNEGLYAENLWADSAWVDFAWTDSLWTEYTWADWLWVDSSWTDVAIATESWNDELHADELWADTAYIDLADVDHLATGSFEVGYTFENVTPATTEISVKDLGLLVLSASEAVNMPALTDGVNGQIIRIINGGVFDITVVAGSNDQFAPANIVVPSYGIVTAVQFNGNWFVED